MPKLSFAQGKYYKWAAFTAIAIGTFTSVVDHGSVGVALPTIADHFLTDLPTTQWVLIGYALTISALLLPMGRLSDIVGLKQIYVAGFAIFVAGAVLAGISNSILILIMAKVLQGVGSAMTQGTGMAMILSTFSADERGKALGLQMSVVGTGGIAGPAVGGLIVGALGWRWVFFTEVALGALAITAALVAIDASRVQKSGSRGQFDWPGAAFSTSALVIFLLAMTLAPRLGWLSAPIGAALLVFLALVGAFIYWELRTPAPMMDLRLFQRKLFSFGVSASFLSFLGMSSPRFLMPFYLQAVLGYSPIQIGLIIVPSALFTAVIGPLSGRFSDRYGWRMFNVGGLVFSASGLFMLSTLRGNSSLGLVLVGMIFQTIGLGLFNAPNNSSILSVVEQSRYGVLSGFLNLVRNSANVTGIALTTAVVTAIMVSMGQPPTLAAVSESGGAEILDAFVSGMRVAFVTMGGLVVLGAAVSFLKGGQRKPALEERADGRQVGSQSLD